MSNGTPPPGRAAPFAPLRWATLALWWNIAFLVAVGLAAVISIRNAVYLADAGLLMELGGLAALTACYFAVGVPGLRSNDPRKMLGYLAILVAVIGLAAGHANTLVNPLLIIGFSHCWLFTQGRRGPGLLACGALSAACTLGLWAYHGFSGTWLLGYLPTLAIMLGFSSAVGLAFAHSEQQSRRNAELADELALTQDALAQAQFAAGISAERARMTREIHDTLAQGFAVLGVQAQLAQAQVRAGSTDAALEVLEKSREICSANLAEARSIVEDRSPVLLEERGSLRRALATLVEGWSIDTGIAATADLEEMPTLSPQAEQALFRAGQEALTNVRRHADASRVTLRLYTADDRGRAQPVTPSRVVLAVSDDGIGLGPDHAEGHGLTGMRSRAAGLGGAVTSVPLADGGVEIRVSLPLD